MAKLSHIYLIVNLAAGQQEPVLEIFRRVFCNSEQEVTVHVLKEGEHAGQLVKEAINYADLIAIYGGDGSVTEAASALIGTNTPLAIIPGGTANVLATELNIPQDTETALKLIRDGNFKLKTIDTGLVNNRPFLLRINLGIMDSMITETDPNLKDQIGQLAYGVSTIKSIAQAEQVNYQLDIDGRFITATGVSLAVTNSGSVGIGGLQLQPGIKIDDGVLDIVLLKDTGILSLIKAAGGSLFNTETDAISHWTGREITIRMPDKQLYLCDDCEDRAGKLHIRIVPASLSVVVPSVS